jgi:hypothetical protein
MAFIVLPDLHLGLTRSYVTKIDYPKYILDLFKDIVINQFPDHKIILLGDLKENAGVKSKYELEENALLYSLLDRLYVVKGNGKHAYDTIKQGETFESKYGEDFKQLTIDGVSVALIGYQKEQEQLDYYIGVADKTADIICTHNFIEPTKFGAYVKDCNALLLAGHNHKQSDRGNRICLGSLANTDFQSCSDEVWVYESEVDDIVKFNRYPFKKYVWREGLEIQDDAVVQLEIPNDRPDLTVKFEGVVDQFTFSDASKQQDNQDVGLVEEGDLLTQWSEFAKDKGSDVVELGLEVLK